MGAPVDPWKWKGGGGSQTPYQNRGGLGGGLRAIQDIVDTQWYMDQYKNFHQSLAGGTPAAPPAVQQPSSASSTVSDVAIRTPSNGERLMNQLVQRLENADKKT